MVPFAQKCTTGDQLELSMLALVALHTHDASDVTIRHDMSLVLSDCTTHLQVLVR